MPGTFQLWNGKFLLGQNGKMAVHPACCCGEEDASCECGDIVIDIDGVTDGYACSDCESFNREWILPLVQSSKEGDKVHCRWKVLHEICDDGYWNEDTYAITADLWINQSDTGVPLPGNAYLYVRIEHGTQTTVVWYRNLDAEGLKCSDLLGVMAINCWGNSFCTGRLATCEVTRWDINPLP